MSAMLWMRSLEILAAVDEAAQRQLSAALLATSINRHGWRHGTTDKNRAQPRGRASGVRCKAMLGGVVENMGKKHSEYRCYGL